MKSVKILLVLSLCVMGPVSSYAIEKTLTGFYWPIGESGFDQKCGTWLGRDNNHGGCYFTGKYHIGVDMMTYTNNSDSEQSHVYAVSDGKIILKHCSNDSWGPGNCALFIEHKTIDGEVFIGLYGHLRTFLKQDDEVYAGKLIGTTGEWSNGEHLHFGVILGNTIPGTNVSQGIGWGMMSNNHWNEDWPNKTNYFVDPINFLNTHYPNNDLNSNPQTEQEVHTKAYANSGRLAWLPLGSSCKDATKWIDIDTGTVVADKSIQSVDGNYVCENYGIYPNCSM